MTAALLLFISTFFLVFCLGLQSLFVNNRHYAFAFLNSLCIGSANLVLFKMAAHATGWQVTAYLAGGPLGIVASMAAYRFFKRY